VKTRIIGTGLVGVIAAALALVGGCGGGSPRLSAREYVSRTSAVCARANRAISRVTQPSDGRAVHMVSATVRVVAIHRDALDSLRALRPPKVYETTAKLWIALVDQSVDELDSMRVSLQEGDNSAAMAYAEKADELDARSRVIAGKYGITPCEVPDLIV
jgi:hypothetical protein